MTSVVLMVPSAFLRVLVDLWSATQPRTAHSSLLAPTRWSVPPSSWRHRRARVTAHHTLPLYLLLTHPSICAPSPHPRLPCHRAQRVNAAFTVKCSSFLYSFLLSLCPSAPFTAPPALGGWPCEWRTVVKSHFSPSHLLLFSPPQFSQRPLVKAPELRSLSHVAYSYQTVDELTALPLLTQWLRLMMMMLLGFSLLAHCNVLDGSKVNCYGPFVALCNLHI